MSFDTKVFKKPNLWSHLNVRIGAGGVFAFLFLLTIQSFGQTVIFQDDFETDKGWTLTGEFERGTPQGLGGVNYGNPDPSSAENGVYVLGTDITGLGTNIGDYEPNVSDRGYSATSPVINCSDYTNVILDFQRWLNVEVPAYDHAYIEVTNDGSTWNVVWENSSEITDNSWSLETVDISAYADDSPTLQVRFSIGSTDGGWQYSGWNIDEFEVRGDPPATPPDVYYSYQTGNWNDPDTWTSDPSGTTLVGSSVPGDGDKVVILDGRTISLTTDVSTSELDINIRQNGILDQAEYQFSNGINTLSGSGIFRLSSINFPSVNYNLFIQANGGTTEYYNSADFTLPASQDEYNHLLINAPGVTATQLSDITLNGDLQVQQGTFRINDNTSTTKLNLTINGNVQVENSAHLTVGQGPTNTTTDPNGITGGTPPFIDYYEHFHRVVVYGDFTNNGTVRFTNLDYPVFNAFPPTTAGPTSGAATVYFRGATDNRLECNNTTDFYNLVLDKGVDQTYSLTVYSSGYDHFRLFGANSSGGDTNGATAENPNLKKALWIRTGTLELDGLAIIPSLSEGGGGGTPNSDFYVPANGALELNGPEVVVLSSADTYEEVNVAYNVSGGTGAVNGVNAGSTASSFSILGKLEVNEGYFSTRESGGFIAWDYAAGKLIINGGVIDAKQFRSAGSSGGLAAYRQTGGTFILRGRFQRTPAQYTSVEDLKDFSTTTLNTTRSTNGLNGSLGTFNLNEPENAFFTSGGTVKIYDVCGTGGGNERAFEVFADLSNINVQGGTLEIIPTTGSGTDAVNYIIETTAELGNLTINRASGSANVLLNNYPLTVNQDLNLQSGVFDANNLDVHVGGDFLISSGTTYNPGNNWTVFNGSGSQALTVDLASPLNLNKFKIDKPTGTTLQLQGSQNTINIADSVMIYDATFNDNGKTVNVAQSIYHSGIHTGTGKIVLNSINDQDINGDGSGIFENLELNKPNNGNAEVILNSNVTIDGTLSFTGSPSGYKLLNIDQYNMRLGVDATVSGADANRFITTNGEVGNRGVTKVYSSASSSFTFPVGAPSTNHASPEYTPAAIGFTSDPTSYGTVTVIPVGIEHPTVTTTGQSLTYYWRVKSSGFSGIPSGAVSHSFTYSQNDVVGTEANYQPAIYDPETYTWSNGTTGNPPIDITTNTFTDWTNPTNSTDILEGEYTAGENAFGTPTIYYSRQTGLWGNTNTWSLVDHNGSPAGSVPGSSDIVIIGGQDSVYLNSNLTTPDVNAVSCASLKIEEGSALDIGYNPNCDFGTVLSHENGNGNFRLTTSYNTGSTYQFPAGDFSDFNVNLGTTELYTTNPNAGTTYWLPNDITSYGNLIISPIGGSNIIFGNTDVLIYGDLITRGQNSRSWFSPSWRTSTYPTAPNVPVSKTITIKGNFDLQGGALVWYNRNYTGAQDFVVGGDLILDTGAGIQVYTNGSNNSQSISIGGSLINNSLEPAGYPNGYRGADFRDIPLIFKGDDVEYITNDDPSDNTYTIIESLTVDKGSAQTDSLVVDITGTFSTPNNGWLTLKNGTFKYLHDDNLSITRNSSFTIPPTAGLYLNSSGNSIYLANDNVNDNDVYLNGKLTIIDGDVYIGETGAPNNNNDIEYSAGGLAEIEIQGGSLTVNGQIRRNVNTDAGVLNYTQSGGSLTVNGRNSNTDNAKLEILNAGSSFNMSAGTINIIRGGGGNTYGDLYLRPESSNVTGGEIIFSQGASGAGVESYILDANFALNDLTINGTGGNDAEVQLLISPLNLQGDLTLTNSNSILDANSNFDIDVTINGDFNNSGVYKHYSNTTTFDGDVQAITGSSTVDFYDLTVNSLTSLTLNREATVNNDLDLENGTLICGTNPVNVHGDFTNNATYTETGSGVILNGTSQQHISGTGTFGRLELDNMAGARVDNDLTLQKDLVLTTGILDINEHLLTLGINSDILGAPFDDTKMITSDGVLSNVGIQKVFDTYSGAAQTFTFPIGTAGKYTPAEFTYTDNTNVGYIRVNNINAHHPGVVDKDNVLDYYWEVESSAISGFNGEMVLNYLESDVQGTQESDYIAARLLLPGDSWSKAAPGPGTDNVDEANNTITFSYSGSDDLSGEYTAGLDAAIPDNVPEYTSTNDGDWNTPANWTQTGGDPYTLTGGPNGFKVIVDHNIELDANHSSAYRTIINGQLNVIEPYYGHNLGKVEGNGTLYLEDGMLPAGRYTDFLDCSGDGTLEYGGNGDYTIVGDLFTSIPNIHFTGTGTRILPNKDLIICHQFLIDGATVDNSLSNRKLTIQGTMERYNGGAFLSGSGAGAIVSFAGTSAQTLGGALGDFTGSNAFNHLEINNPAGLTINSGGAVEVEGDLYLTDGNITTGSNNTLTITNTSPNCVVPAGGGTNSYVDGPLTKRINQGDDFLFPIGKGEEIGNKLTLSGTQTGTQLWTAEYFNPNPTATDMATPLTYVNADDYWTVRAPSGSQAVVNLEWNALSDLTPLMTENGLSDMRVARFNTTNSEWEELTSNAAGDDYDGTVFTTSRVTIPAAGSSDFTTACINAVKPRAKLEPTGPVCGADGIPVSFTATGAIPFDYILEYTIDGTPQTPITITSGDLPYTLPTPVAGEYQLTSFRYDSGNELGVVDANTVTAYELPTTADAGSNQTLCGATSATLNANTPAVGTGVWSIVSGTGGTVVSPTSPTSTFNGTNGSDYTLVWTISNGSCTSTDTVNISFPLLPVQPEDFTESTSEVCENATNVTYTVPLDPTVTYSWNYTGAGVTINGTGNSVTLDFSIGATSGDLEVTATNGCGTSAPRTISITVNTLPVADAGVDTSLCYPNSIQLSPSGGIDYSWSPTIYLDDPSLQYPTVTPPVNPASASDVVTYTVTVTDSNGCVNTDDVQVVIYRRPETGNMYYVPNSFDQ